ncbi:MAG: GtrA family protein [Acidobacteria bacterium]|nr:GtrA family protein [Acidobacteriota bacterium]
MRFRAEGETWGDVARHYFKFNAVGAVGIGVQLALLAALTGVLQVNYLVATALAVEAAVIHNFFWHERWTWEDRASTGRMESLWRFVRFNCTTGAMSVAGNLVLMRVLVGYSQLHYLPANMITIAACSVLNFLVSDWFVFRTRES